MTPCAIVTVGGRQAYCATVAATLARTACATVSNAAPSGIDRWMRRSQKLVVNYVRESAGNVHEVWILNSEEIKLKRPNSKASWFSFVISLG